MYGIAITSFSVAQQQGVTGPILVLKRDISENSVNHRNKQLNIGLFSHY